MIMTPSRRKLTLTFHVVTSVGWLGAVAAFMILSIAAVTSQRAEIVTSAYLSMNLIGEFLIVPLSLAAFLTGIIQSLGTPWGLFRYYWVLVKFALTLGATVLLLLHQFTAVASAAKLVAGSTLGMLPAVGRLGPKLVGDSGLAVLVLMAATTLSIYKPWGLTQFGRSEVHGNESSMGDALVPSTMPVGLKIFMAGVLCLLLAGVIFSHLSGAMHGHFHH